MEENRIAEVFAKAQAREAEAWGLFEARFDKQFPMPETPNVQLMNAVGWQFIATIVQSAAAVILAALRTAQMFYDAAAGLFWGGPLAEAISAVLAVELGIVIFSTIKSEAKNRTTEIENLNQVLDINVKLLNAGIIACLLVSAIAGLGVSLQGFGIDVTNYKKVLAVTMGLGASIIAWVSGDILGAILARFSNARLAAKAKYDQAVKTRVEDKNSMWENAPERKIARSELMELQKYLQAQRSANEQKQAPLPTPAPKPEPVQRKTSTRSNEIRVKIYNYLDGDWSQHGDITLIPGPTKLMEELGVAKGYASQVIKEWRADRKIDEQQAADNGTLSNQDAPNVQAQ
jgi:hypothetical protein